MDLFKFLEYGPAVVAVVGLIYVSKLLAGIIKNHISDATKATGEHTRVSQHLADVIGQMLRFLEKKNGV